MTPEKVAHVSSERALGRANVGSLASGQVEQREPQALAKHEWSAFEKHWARLRQRWIAPMHVTRIGGAAPDQAVLELAELDRAPTGVHEELPLPVPFAVSIVYRAVVVIVEKMNVEAALYPAHAVLEEALVESRMTRPCHSPERLGEVMNHEGVLTILAAILVG